MRNLTLNLTNLSLVLLVMGLSAIEAGAQDSGVRDSGVRDSGVQKPADSKAKSAGSYAAEVTASRLHLRSGPGGSSQSVVLAEQGDKLIVRDAAAGGWAIIEVPGGFNAWGNARYVERGADGIGVSLVWRALRRPTP